MTLNMIAGTAVAVVVLVVAVYALISDCRRDRQASATARALAGMSRLDEELDWAWSAQTVEEE